MHLIEIPSISDMFKITKVLLINRGNKKVVVCAKTSSFEASDCFVYKPAQVEFRTFDSKHIGIVVLMVYWMYREKYMQGPLVVSIFIQLV
jgi:hypothetical protein